MTSFTILSVFYRKNTFSLKNTFKLSEKSPSFAVYVKPFCTLHFLLDNKILSIHSSKKNHRIIFICNEVILSRPSVHSYNRESIYITPPKWNENNLFYI